MNGNPRERLLREAGAGGLMADAAHAHHGQGRRATAACS